MKAEVIEALEKWSVRKKNQYTGLYDVSVEVGDEEQAAYAVSQLMAYKIPLTDEQRSLLDKSQVYCGNRDVRSENYADCSTKWLLGNYEATIEFGVEGRNDGQVVEIGEDDRGNKEYDTKEEQYGGVITEITTRKEIVDFGAKMRAIATNNNGKLMAYSEEQIEEMMSGLGFIYKIGLIDGVEEYTDLGYTVVMGIPGKKGYIYVNFIDYKACEALNIDGLKFKNKISKLIKLSLETQNKDYSALDKSVM